jgi:hypothetical protein
LNREIEAKESSIYDILDRIYDNTPVENVEAKKVILATALEVQNKKKEILETTNSSDFSSARAGESFSEGKSLHDLPYQKYVESCQKTLSALDDFSDAKREHDDKKALMSLENALNPTDSTISAKGPNYNGPANTEGNYSISGPGNNAGAGATPHNARRVNPLNPEGQTPTEYIIERQGLDFSPIEDQLDD